MRSLSGELSKDAYDSHYRCCFWALSYAASASVQGTYIATASV